VAAVLLAAGASSRYGAHKLLERIDGIPLVRAAAQRLLAAEPWEAVVVVGREHERVTRALDGLGLRIVVNHEHARGMSGSLHAGIRAVSGAADAALIALADQPGVDPAVVRRLISAWARGGASIVAPSYRGDRGHPVLFSRALFGALLAVEGDRGARDVIAAAGDGVHLVEVDAEAPADVDTPEDLARLARLARPH
jgi:molybdenum cofactor cytidylyltransferase